MRIYNRFIASLIVLSMLTSMLLGCGTTEDDGKNDNITLNAPAGVTADYDVVTERNMYAVEVYPSSVNPVVTEYAFAKDQSFKKYGATPGEAVNPGDALVYSETKNLDNQIKNLEEELEDMEASHALSVAGLKLDIEDAKKAEYEASEGYMQVLAYEPDKDSEGYDGWAAMAAMPERAYKSAVQNRERTELALKQSEEMYALEHEYKLGNIERVRNKINDATITANVKGEVVACNYYYNGNWITKDTSVIAVGDTTQRVLNTEYISKATINKALDIYAVIDGKRYEIQYVNMDPEEYKQLSESGESVYTTFVLVDMDEEVQIGTYAVVVMVKDTRTSVPCIPNDALKKETDGYYTYLYDGEETKYVPVEIGMRDGLYSEVLSGVSVGDKVLSSAVPKKTNNTAQVTRGDYSSETEIGGFLYYPFSEWVTNPVEYGSTYLKEMLVSNNEKVEAGQVLATLEVIADDIEIARINRQIARLSSRLDKKKAEMYDYNARKVTNHGLEKEIAQDEQTLSQYRRTLNKLTKYSGIIEVTSPCSGIVMEADALKPGDLVGAGANIVEVANDSLSYIMLKDDKNQLNYGNDAEIKITSSNGASTIQGKVVSVNKMCLSKALTNDFSLIAIPHDEMAAVAGTTMVDGGRWDRNSFKVKVKVRSEKNVLMVPKAAVTLKDKSTYVTVIKEDGSVQNVSFIAGGSDVNYYWIIDGLTEGMTVCWE